MSLMSFISDSRIMVIGILLESFPFILLGVAISALLQTFISDQTLQRWIPKKTIPGILFGCLLGIIFPLCECGIIPVVHRLIRKGMPPYIGIVFMMAGPVFKTSSPWDDSRCGAVSQTLCRLPFSSRPIPPNYGTTMRMRSPSAPSKNACLTVKTY
ncbi:hypothetical protein J2X61_005502 [Bacillus sp. 3255]|nr:permease [Bacillus sp. 3255]MDR6883704.1 hypothetical protein [Bacillus sp. 3255]